MLSTPISNVSQFGRHIYQHCQYLDTYRLVRDTEPLGKFVCQKKICEQQFDFLLLALFGSSGFSISVLYSLLVYRYYCCLAFAYAKSLSSVYLTALKPPVLEEFF